MSNSTLKILPPLIASIALLCLTPIPATAVTFNDTTFNLANYSETPIGVTSGATVSFTQCPSCGNPGNALQILGTFATTTDGFDVGFVNNTFAYNPATQGAIATIDASVDKNIITNVPIDPTIMIEDTFRPLIEQDGLFYLAAINGPIFHGGSTGFLNLSQTGLVATDFTQFNFTNGTFGTGHPNFAGDPMLFGLAQLSTAAINNATVEVDYDNLKLSIRAVPDSGSTGVLLLGSLAALLLLSRMCQHRQAS